jgi:hypothetical protein
MSWIWRAFMANRSSKVRAGIEAEFSRGKGNHRELPPPIAVAVWEGREFVASQFMATIRILLTMTMESSKFPGPTIRRG